MLLHTCMQTWHTLIMGVLFSCFLVDECISFLKENSCVISTGWSTHSLERKDKIQKKAVSLFLTLLLFLYNLSFLSEKKMRVSKAGNRVKERVGEVKLPLEIYRIIGLGNWLQRAPPPMLPLRQLDFHISYHATLLIPPHSIHILFVICKDEKRKKCLVHVFLSFLLLFLVKRNSLIWQVMSAVAFLPFF